VFQFAGKGTVAKAMPASPGCITYAARNGAHFWPFDGWQVSLGTSVLAEVQPRLWGSYTVSGLVPARQNAFTAASWLRDADMAGSAAAVAAT
jgi:hypothetical protein